MNKAFISDMDGVLVDSEQYWTQFEEEFFQKTFGGEIAKQIGHGPGRGVDGVYELLLGRGVTIDKETYMRGFEQVAMQVYDHAPITPGVDKLVDFLVANDFKIGLVTQSRKSWIDRVIPRLPFKDRLESIVSIGERPDLKSKPSPDGFLAAFRELKSDPAGSLVLEDSNPGIASGKASGAFTIGYSGNLLAGYQQTGADAYADTMDDVIKLVEKFSRL